MTTWKLSITSVENRIFDSLEILVLDLLLSRPRLTRNSNVKQTSDKANFMLREYIKLYKALAMPVIEYTALVR